MEIKNRDQIYHILQNLSNLEISYVDYSRQEINYNEYHTYFDYFNNYVIQNHNLTRFYFPIPKDMEHLEYPNDISNFDVISDSLDILLDLISPSANFLIFPSLPRTSAIITVCSILWKEMPICKFKMSVFMFCRGLLPDSSQYPLRCYGSPGVYRYFPRYAKKFSQF